MPKTVGSVLSRKATEFFTGAPARGNGFPEESLGTFPADSFRETASYKDIAVAVGNEKAVRAVGGANGKNNIAIIIPCHQVIGADGNLVEFGGALWRKVWLLNHEKK